MKQRFICAWLLLSAAIACLATDNKWELVWCDEFNIDGQPDPERWSYESGFIRNQELQYYTAKENARVENGRLIIEARKERFPNARHVAGSTDWRRSREFAEYTSASLTTQDKAQWKYGRIEVRAKVPQGRGVWPAIWMLGTNKTAVGWPRCGEIDIMEYVGFKPDLIHANVHTAKYNHVRRTGKGKQITVKAPFQDFHIYAINWHADRIEFFVNEENFFTYKKESEADEDVWPFDRPFYLILNLAIGGGWGGKEGIDDTIFPQRYEIDYVRAYKQRTSGRAGEVVIIPDENSYAAARRFWRDLSPSPGSRRDRFA